MRRGEEAWRFGEVGRLKEEVEWVEAGRLECRLGGF